MLKYFENLSDLKKIVTGWCSICGWFCGLVLLDVGTFWMYILKGIGGVCFAVIGVFSGLLVTDVYKLRLKDKIFKNKKDGNEKTDKENQADNERVA